MANANELRSHKTGNHIKRNYHSLREIVQRGDVMVCKIALANHLADPFTKTLLQKSFDSHLEGFGMRDMIHLL